MSATDRFVILAAGEPRWRDGRVPRHLVEVEGERLLERTVRLFRPFGEVIVSAPRDARYRIVGAGTFVPHRRRRFGAAERTLTTRAAWGEGRTVLLLGDVWYSDAAAATIAAPVRGWRLYGREGASCRTGGPWGEPWAWSFGRRHHDAIVAANLAAVAAVQRGIYPRADWWEAYRAMEGWRPSPCHRVGRHFVEIDDWTEDFDDADELAAWLEHRALDIHDSSQLPSSTAS